jgi:uncharacterized protein
MNMTQAPTRAANRLAQEKSPYLLQHQFNPVDWYAWGEEAFARAGREQKPVFLSIGYSTCHWCHVMERESFENEKIAAFLNEHFISVKVDREERPDVDKIYMLFVQASTGHGGWPMSVFLTPDRKPFFGGTYFPPESRAGQPGFLDLLNQIHQIWEQRQGDIVASAEDIHARLTQATAAGAQRRGDAELSTGMLQQAGFALKRNYDPHNGGFGGAPKFPQPSHPRFLLRYAKRFDDAEAIRIVLHTCDQMARGGIHDQLGGGFARYAVDAQWLVPHFEKMLYDNAQLADLYLDAFLISGEERFASVARDILDYVLRDMTDPRGGFYSAEDADSEGHEGKFYCWTRQELRELLSPDEFEVAARYYGISEQGNFVDHSHPQPLPNQNVLSVVDPDLNGTEARLLHSAKAKLLGARAARVRPHRDDKVLVSWNGLMLGAFARAGIILGDERYRTAAEKNAAFIKQHLWDGGSRTLYHRWRDGQRDRVQLLEAYAFLLAGLLELYQTTLEPAHLEWSLSIAEELLARFYDRENGGFWQSPADTHDLVLRVKDDYDGAEPSGNSVAILAFLQLAKITGRPEFSEAAAKSLQLFAARLDELPQAVPYMLQALDFGLEEPRRIAIAARSNRAALPLLAAAHSVYQPNKIVLSTKGPVEEFARTLPIIDQPQAFVCIGTECRPPIADPESLREALR